MKQVSISVQIVTFNSESYIIKCLEALEEQSYHIEQVIIIDNASSDRTLQFVEQRSWQFKHQIIRNEKNNGFAEAHNQGIRITETDYVLVLNPDVFLSPNYLEEIIKIAVQDPGIGMFTGKLLFMDNQEEVDSAGVVLTRSRRAFDRGANEKRSDWTISSEVFGVSGAAAVYSREFIRSVMYENDFFDTTFFAYKEDVDVAWRGRLLGWKAFFVSTAIGLHSRGWRVGGRKKQPLKIRRHSYINRYYMMLKNDRFSDIVLDLPYILKYELLSVIYFLFREPLVLLSWVDFWKNIRSTLRKRKVCMNTRISKVNKL